MRSLSIIASVLLASSVPALAQDHSHHGVETSKSPLQAAIIGPNRTPANVARDAHRHPLETLQFFGVKPSDTIVEIYPGGGWYSEILAPFTKSGGGTFYLAGPWARLARLQAWPAQDEAAYGAMKFAEFPASSTNPKVPDGTADVVLTFRNVHNMRMDGTEKAEAAFREMFAMLKPGGVLGVVDHRLNEGADSKLEETSGYMKESSVIALATAAGFTLADRSEINANPKDSKDHPKGVWTLPPTLAQKDVDREKYLAIGESDRMTLKFVKPAN